MSALLGAKATWYLMRGSGFVAFALLTITVCVGIANLSRWQPGGWTRTVTAFVHRNVSLLAIVFLGVHIATAVSDKYESIPVASVLVPGRSGYDPLWIGLGAVALDVMLAVVVTSVVRARLGHRAWRAVHWLAYLSWPTALIHSVGAGTGNGVDTGHVWSTVIYVSTGLVFTAAVAARLRLGSERRFPRPPGRPVPALAGNRPRSAL
jgi:sulfoxide reductase heme-binding subunit YedZ